MSALSNQMQEKMTIRLSELRHRVIGQMTSAGERIKKRPSLPGDTALKTISDHQVMKKNDDGFQILSVALGVPGLSETASTMADVAIDIYADRQATRMRPQDTDELSPRQARQIRESNAADLKEFMALDEKLTFLDAAISSGDIIGVPCPESDTLFTLTAEDAMKQGLSVPRADINSGNKTLKPSDAFIAYHASKGPHKAIGLHRNH